MERIFRSSSAAACGMLWPGGYGPATTTMSCCGMSGTVPVLYAWTKRWAHSTRSCVAEAARTAERTRNGGEPYRTTTSCRRSGSRRVCVVECGIRRTTVRRVIFIVHASLRRCHSSSGPVSPPSEYGCGLLPGELAVLLGLDRLTLSMGISLDQEESTNRNASDRDACGSVPP